MNISPVIPQSQPKLSRFSMWWVIAVNCATALLAIRYYSIPTGMEIRPMGDAVLLFVLIVCGLIGIPLVLPTLFKHRRLIWPWLVVSLSLCPYPLFMLIFHHVEHVRRFVLEP
jgi:hypothetical protein